MGLKSEYSRLVALRCMTCGASYAFETDMKTGYVTCQKCNRVYRGGKEELIELNKILLEDEKNLLVEVVRKDVEEEFKKIFKNITIKI